MTKKEIAVKRSEGSEPIEVIAEHITKISEAVASLMNGLLKEKTIVLLLAASSGLGKRDILKVLRAIESLGADYLVEEGSE